MAKAVILAAGEGTRLRPYTDHIPKVLVSFGGQTLLSRQLAALRSAGINDISVVAGYCAKALEATGVPLYHNPRYASTNMVASLYSARQLFDGCDDIVVAYGDIVYEPRVLATLLASPPPLSAVVDLGWQKLWRLRMDDPLADAETLRMDPAGNILELGGKSGSLAEIEGQYIGLVKVSQVFAPRFFSLYEQLHQNHPAYGSALDKMYMTAYLQYQINAGIQVRAATVANGWLEIDSVQDLERYESALAQGLLTPLYRDIV